MTLCHDINALINLPGFVFEQGEKIRRRNNKEAASTSELSDPITNGDSTSSNDRSHGANKSRGQVDRNNKFQLEVGRKEAECDIDKGVVLCYRSNYLWWCRVQILGQ